MTVALEAVAGARHPGGGPEPWRRHASLAATDYRPHLIHRGRPRTLYLRLETVNTCNNLCTICAYRDHQRPKSVMPMEMFRKTVADFIDMGGGYVSLTPLVGDVFMDKHLPARVAYLRDQSGVTGIGFTTNAAMAHRFDDAALGDLLAPVTRISLSIYGVGADEYREITRRDTYDRMKEGIRRIVALSPAPVSLEFRLFRRQTHEQLAEWLRSEVFAPGEMPSMPERMSINSVITDYANWGIYDSRNTPLPHDARWFAESRAENRPQCLIPLFAFLVYSNGNVSFCPCDNFNDTEELRIGNVLETSLGDIYASPRVQQLWDWEGCGTPDFCKGCSFHIPLSLLDSNPTLLADPHQIVGAG